MSILSIYTTIVAFAENALNSNPKLKFVDWSRSVPGISVENPQSRQFILAPGESLTVFSGVRTTAIDGTTTMSIALNPVNSSVYRITRTSGTAPAFRTDRALTLNTEVVTVTVNNNATADFSLSSISAGTFAAVSVGDIMFIPHTATGDAALSSPFSSSNGGFWVVLAKGEVSAVPNKKLTVARLSGEEFLAVAEVVTLTSNAQLACFSSAGVQVGDSLEISAGFSSVTFKTFEISQVTPSWVEFTSTDSLPLETGILPTATGMVFYTNAKSYVRVETDQEAVLRFNGDTGNTNRLSPRIVADPEAMAWLEKFGPAWTLDVVNRSTIGQMTVNVITAE